MRGQRTDDDRIAVLLDAFQLCDTREIDDRAGIGEPQLHRSDEALSARQRLPAALAQRSSGVGNRLRTLIFECVHDLRLRFSAWPPGSRSTRDAAMRACPCISPQPRT